MPYLGRTPSAVPVTADDIPANSIDASKIIDGSIELAEIADNSITDAKLNSSKLDGIETGATNYIHPTTHATADIVDNAITEAKIADAAVVSLKSGRKNLLINGGFDVWQRGTTFTPTGVDYMADRWFMGGGDYACTVTKQAATLPNGDNVNTMRVSYTASGTNYIDPYQGIEDYKLLSGKIVTLSCWIKTNINGLAFRQYSTGSYGSVATSDGQWHRIIATATLPAITSTSKGVNSPFFGVSSGGTITTNAGDYVEFTNFQLELGTVATDFEHRSYGEELALCKRYTRVLNEGRLGGVVNGSGNCIITNSLSQGMRANPSNSIVGTLGVYYMSGATQINTNATSILSGHMPHLVKADGSTGDGSHWWTDLTTTNFIILDSEI